MPTRIPSEKESSARARLLISDAHKKIAAKKAADALIAARDALRRSMKDQAEALRVVETLIDDFQRTSDAPLP